MHIIALGGPTATGKTAIATSLAHALGIDVVSADSRQVYRGLDIGTGKDLAEYRRFDPPVRHHLIDIVDPSEVYSLFQYQADCFRTLEALSRESGSRGKAVVLAGGTGLYMEAVLRRYRIANVPEDPALRERYSGWTREELEAELLRLDPALADRTDRTSRKRILRSLEVYEAARIKPVEYSRLPETGHSHTLFVTTMERGAIRARIDRRLEQRLAEGMVEEVEGLLRRGLPPGRLKLLGMEYREITAYLLGEKPKDKMVEDLRHEIHLLAKRQETWFRGMETRGLKVHWLKDGEGAEAVEKAWREGTGKA